MKTEQDWEVLNSNVKEGHGTFHLVRYFTTTSLIVFILVAILLGSYYRSTAVNNLLQLGEDKNISLTQAFANSLWPVYAPFLNSTVGLNGEALRDRPEIALLRRIPREATLQDCDQ